MASTVASRREGCGFYSDPFCVECMPQVDWLHFALFSLYRQFGLVGL